VNPTELVPLLVLVILLASASGADPERMTVTFEGEHTVDSIEDLHVVAGGTTTVPAGASVDGDVYAIGGTTRIAGAVDGDVTVLAGNVTLSEGASVTGTVRTISGQVSVSEGATVGALDRFEPPASDTSPARRVATLLLQFVVLGGAGWLLARRAPALLDTVGHSVTAHPVVSGVVGSLAAVSLLVLFVYMAFTLLLLPVSLLGLLGQFLVVLYAQIVFGHLVGRRLPVDRVEVATPLGVGVVLLAFEVLGVVPYVGALVQLAAIAVGFGAVLNTYFGLRRFEPVRLSAGEL
jgi:cytoskeletal protein CcmA (bactofilin family)